MCWGPRMRLDQKMLAEMRNTILADIVAAAEDALRCHSAAEGPDGENFADNWVLGCACWRILFNRLNRHLEDSKFFKKNVYSNVMQISCPNGDDNFTFYVYRVNDEIRIPKGARSLKIYLQDQLWLSEEIKSRAVANGNGVNIIGYDISLESGLGAITLEKLCFTSKNKFEPILLHDFTGAGILMERRNKRHSEPFEITPEEIDKPAVNKEDIFKKRNSSEN